MQTYDVVVIGAGAAGMMCAAEAAKRGRGVLVLDHAQAPGEKIRISGGGRCNFTNVSAEPKHFLSDNPRFAISALKRYTPQDFVALVDAHGVAWHEKAAGQLFCDGSAKQIVTLLLDEMAKAGTELRLGSPVATLEKAAEGFRLTAGGGEIACTSLVIATGGKSIPKMGATGFGYDVASSFGLRLTAIRPALVPLTIETAALARLAPLSGVAVDARASCRKTHFDEALLFTHRGLSGPAILQISSYWREGDELVLDLAPSVDVFGALRQARAGGGRQAVVNVLAQHIPKRLAQHLAETHGAQGQIADAPDTLLKTLSQAVNGWRIKPVGSEGYRTAEVTLGGVDTRDLEGRTLQAKAVPGLYFIGEVVDVTGWLGGYNFQWAWASGWSAGQVA